MMLDRSGRAKEHRPDQAAICFYASPYSFFTVAWRFSREQIVHAWTSYRTASGQSQIFRADWNDAAGLRGRTTINALESYWRNCPQSLCASS